MGAKNHGVIMPDANKEFTVNQLVGAAFGAAGQRWGSSTRPLLTTTSRCMALTTAVMVGDAQNWLPDIAAKAANLRVGPGEDGKYQRQL